MTGSIIVNRDFSERIPYTIPEIFLHASECILSDITAAYKIDNHWHDEIEFILVTEGSLAYYVNGDTFHLKTGEGIFVNARQIHYGFFAGISHCKYICVLMHPIMLCANNYIEQSLVAPVLQNPNFACLHLKPGIPYHREIMDTVLSVFEAERLPGDTKVLNIQSLFYKLWEYLYTVNPSAAKTPAESMPISAMRDMLKFVQCNYAKKLTLSEISAAGRICRSACNTAFQRYLHQSPISYLTEYRLQKSIELLLNSNLSVTEIAFSVGFSGASYFAETFRKSIGYSPTAFRRIFSKSTVESEVNS